MDETGECCSFGHGKSSRYDPLQRLYKDSLMNPSSPLFEPWHNILRATRHLRF